MTIKRFIQVLLSVWLLLALAAAFLTGFGYYINSSLIESQRVRLQSYELIDELRQSSDDQTRFARTYVVTGDPKFEQYYRDVLAIRNGEKPRPEQYHHIYWDFFADLGRAPRPDTPAVPLLQLMKPLGFTAAEFAKLREAQANSDALVRTEEIAMHAVKGLYDDGTGNFIRKGPPDPAMAANILHDAAYHHAKAQIMAPIDDVLVMLDARTAASVEALNRRRAVFRDLMLGIVILFLALLAVSYSVIRREIKAIAELQNQTRIVGSDLDHLAAIALGIANGDLTESFTASAVPLASMRRNEVGELSRLHDAMIGRLQETGAAIATITGELTRTNEALMVENAERRRAEVELQGSRDSALNETRVKAQFLANMSHEIRTPMNGVIGMTRLLMQTPLNDEQREFTETIRTSGDTLLTVINEILDFSKLEAGERRFETIDLDLLGIVEGVADLLAESAQSKGLEMAAWIDSDVPTALRGDPTQLRQVLTNLVSNAIKFTKQGEVVVRVARREVTPTHVTLRFSVADTGIGMSEEGRKRLFQPFAQADDSTTRQFGGTGLGLVICKKLVELMGGEIGVESAPGKGATFWFTARLETQTAGNALQPAEPPSLSNLKVLVVDDNRTNRDIMCAMLASWKLRHTEADSGSRALQLLRHAVDENDPFQVALIDMKMPGMDGPALVRAIHAEAAIAPTRLVMLIPFGDRECREESQAAGVAVCLSKPVKQSALFDSLATIMDKAVPVTLATVAPVPTAAETNETKIGVRILIAEDNVVNRRIASLQLQRLGYSTEFVADGHQAVASVAHQPWDIVFMDCEMPLMDGYEATRAIRKLEVERRTPIVAMTAHALEGDREKCLAAGMDDYIVKPVRLEDLERILKQWLPA